MSLILESCSEGLCLLLVAWLAQKSEHVLLVSLYARLVERIHTEDITADTACLLEEIEEGSEVVLVDALDAERELRHTTVEDGERTLMETVVTVEKSKRSMLIENDPQNLDGLNFLTGKHVEECNAMAELGTKLAHIDGGVPQIGLSIECVNEYNLGALFYFFEKACGISGYVLGVNPFDQPGVEAYKKNMFALLGKPGYEEMAEALKARL